MNGYPIVALGGWGFSERVLHGILPDPAHSEITLLASYPPQTVLEKVCTALKSRPHQLIGWSLGALLSLECAAAHPDAVPFLVLISPTARFTTADGYDCGQPPSLLRAMKQKLQRQPQAVLWEFYRQCFSPIPLPADVDSLLPLSELEPRVEDLAQALDYLLAIDARPHLSRIQASVVIIHGGRDAVIPLAAADNLTAALRDRVLAQITLPGAGHALPLTHAPILQRLVQLLVS